MNKMSFLSWTKYTQLQYDSTAPQTTCPKMTIKLNQHPSKTVLTKTEYYNLIYCNIIVLDHISFGSVFLINFIEILFYMITWQLTLNRLAAVCSPTASPLKQEQEPVCWAVVEKCKMFRLVVTSLSVIYEWRRFTAQSFICAEFITFKPKRKAKNNIER